VGLADGRVVLHNIRFDEELCTLHNAAAAGTAAERFLTGSKAALAAAAASPAVTSLAFRTGAGLPLLAVGGSAGVVALWNLEQRCLHHVLRDAHDGALTALHFFAGEPRLMSAAADNSVKQWVSSGAEGVHLPLDACMCCIGVSLELPLIGSVHACHKPTHTPHRCLMARTRCRGCSSSGVGTARRL
jgi:hypothetical protein